jgi:uncharacterized membrane protein YbhN (UPF0104 family)
VSSLPLQLPLDELPRTPTPRARHVRRALCLLPLLLIAAWAVLNWRMVYDGATRLLSANPWWLLTAAVFTCLCWAAASCMRQGCILERLPPGLLFASQVGAGAANQVLPGGLGAHVVTLRFLRGRGIPFARATASLALYSLVKPVARMVLILTLLAAFPGTVRMGEFVLDERMVLMAVGCVTIGLATAVLIVTFIPPVRRVLLSLLRVALTDARLLHTQPSRVLALWGGAIAFPLLQASTLACVGASLALPLSWQQMVLAYLAASTAVGAIPTPGGIGSVDAALVLTLAAFGAPMALATSTVVGYRVLTVWFPLLPGVIVLSALVRNKVI